MALGRRVLLTVASGSLIYSGMVSALGMGDITLHSALNQPLSAEIDLLDVGDLEADDIRVVLASSTDFARVGVDRLAFLQDLSFTPVIDGDRSRIRVLSNKPVREPYLNFLVEITRAKSRMLREYTVLLDPMPSSPEASNSLIADIPDNVASPARVEPARFVPPAELPLAAQGRRHRVANGESLWTIAGAYAGTRASQAQFMRDIQALNPDAFAGGDAARLSAGANLLLPDAAATMTPAVVEPVSPQPATEAMVEYRQVPESGPAYTASAGPAQAEDQLAQLRRQLFEELAASREENQQLKQMLIDMRLQLENVTAQLAEQGRPPLSASPAAEQLATAVTPERQPVVQPATELIPAEPASAFRWQDWTLPGAGVLISMLLGGWWFSRRKKPDIDYPDAPPLVVAQPTRVPPVPVAAALEMPRQPAHASVSETDVLEAADLYITYGRRDEALEVLLRGIERAPEQLDLRLRHLGLLAESGNIQGYSAAAEAYLQAGGAQAQLDQLLALHPALASAVAAVEPVAPEPFLDPDITFVLNESLTADFLDAFEPAQQSAVDSLKAYPAQPLIDGFDEALTLGELPSLLGHPEPVEPKPTAEELRQLEPNPEHLVRLNQAVAYIKQGDMESACVILETLATEGDEAQRQQVNELLAQIV